jgi:NADH-quinone oxidoreductase subunit G
MVTFSIDGREVTAPENIMLVDGAKYGDVEIPVFCYEPKLGQPVGACRMCLVEIEGIPKLQTGCSTPVKDGMVVHTQTDRVKVAQQAVVEFLLINHPLDCPVCDKGGECPLQDISFGWGGGRSRFIEPKRHFQKPLELSPASSATAACASRRRSARTTSWSSRSAARTRSSAPSTVTRTSRRSAATSSSCARSAR